MTQCTAVSRAISLLAICLSSSYCDLLALVGSAECVRGTPCPQQGLFWLKNLSLCDSDSSVKQYDVGYRDNVTRVWR